MKNPIALVVFLVIVLLMAQTPLNVKAASAVVTGQNAIPEQGLYVEPQSITVPGRQHISMSGNIEKSTTSFDMLLEIGQMGWWYADWEFQNSYFECDREFLNDEAQPYREVFHCKSLDGQEHNVGMFSLESLDVQCQNSQGWVSLQINVGQETYNGQSNCGETFSEPTITIEGDNTSWMGQSNDLEGSYHLLSAYGANWETMEWRWFVDGYEVVEWYSDDDFAHFNTANLPVGNHVILAQARMTFDEFAYPLYGWAEFQYTQESLPTPTITVASFKGQVQWGQLEVSNAGDIELILDTAGRPLKDFQSNEYVWLYLKDKYGRTSQLISNMWNQSTDGKYHMKLYVAQWYEAIWIEPSNVSSVEWIGFGPWQPGTTDGRNGLRKTEEVTKITIQVSDPEVKLWDGKYNPTWDWTVTATPAWAAEQYGLTGNLLWKINTTCNGFGDNHGGMFEWSSILYPELTMGNGVFAEHVLNALEPTDWKVMRPDGTILASGQTLAPICAQSILRLPIITN